MKTESAGHQISPRKYVESGDPVRIAGHRGLFRFVKVWYEEEESGGRYVDVVGPAGKQKTHTFPLNMLKSAPTAATRQDVEMPFELRALSSRAKAGRRG